MHRQPDLLLLKILWVLSALAGLLFLYGLVFNPIHGDEPMIAEHVLRLAEDGVVRSEMSRGFLDYAHRQYLYHKLFVWTGWLVYQIAGMHYLAFRLISLACIAGLLMSLRAFQVKRLNLRPEAWFLSSGLLLVSAHFFSFGPIFRPETIVALMGFGSFYFLEKNREENRLSWLFAAGALAGASSLAHLNGLSFIAAGGLWLLFQRKWTKAALFGFSSLLPLPLHLTALIPDGSWAAMRRQFRGDPNLDDSDFSLAGKLGELLNEHMRFFWDTPAILLSAFFILTLLLFGKRLMQGKGSFLLIYFCCLYISIGLISHGKSTKYGLLYYPFIFSLVAIAIHELWNADFKVWKKTGFLAMALLFFLSNGVLNIFHTRNISPVRAGRELKAILPLDRAGVFMNEQNAYPLLEDYDIHVPMSFDWQYGEKGNGRMPGMDEFFRFMNQQGNKYVVLDKTALSRTKKHLFGGKRFQAGEQLFNYTLFFQNDRWIIFEQTE